MLPGESGISREQEEGRCSELLRKEEPIPTAAQVMPEQGQRNQERRLSPGVKVAPGTWQRLMHHQSLKWTENLRRQKVRWDESSVSRKANTPPESTWLEALHDVRST